MSIVLNINKKLISQIFPLSFQSISFTHSLFLEGNHQIGQVSLISLRAQVCKLFIMLIKFEGT